MQWSPTYFEEMYHDPGIVTLVRSAAEQVAAAARASAPVLTGEYRNSIRVRIKYQQRVVGVVEATSGHAMAVESRTGNLARALRSVSGGSR